ncbi:MAG: NADH:flavin oxidoreductase [Parvularculales bacterium]
MTEKPVMAGKPDGLFSPFILNGLEIPNRIAMAPMTRSHSPGGVPGQDVAAYYKRRVAGGCGLIITEGTTVDHEVASNDPKVPQFHGRDALEGWRGVVEGVHEAGGLIMPQLWHVGIMRRQEQAVNPEYQSAAPSGLFKPGKRVADPMSDAEISKVIDAFARGAAEARKLGFDGVEIHGAHGYLIDQFFWEGTNERDDVYGGDAVGRTRFAAGIVSAIRREVGDDYPLILRFSQWKQQDFAAKLAPSPESLEAFLAPLSAAGVDMFHCSTRRFWEPEFDGSSLNLAGWTKKLSGKPTMTVGSVGLDNEFVAGYRGEGAQATGLDTLLERFEQGEFDMVAVGRAILVDAEWPNKIRNERFDELRNFTTEALATLS